MDLFDSHCHLQLQAFDEDREDVYQRAREAGVERMTIVGIDVETSRDALSFCRNHDGGFPTAGLHPHDADRLEDEEQALRGLIEKPEIAAIGETGLDFHKEYAPREKQKESLSRHIKWAIDVKKPLVFHCRDADDELINLLERFYDKLQAVFPDRPPGVIHCFSGTAEHLKAYREMEFLVSFSGILTFPNAEDLREAASVIDPEGVLVETDSPFLAPQSQRGDRNEPAFVEETTRRLASILDMKPSSLAEMTYNNAERLFVR